MRRRISALGEAFGHFESPQFRTAWGYLLPLTSAEQASGL